MTAGLAGGAIRCRAVTDPPPTGNKTDDDLTTVTRPRYNQKCEVLAANGIGGGHFAKV